MLRFFFLPSGELEMGRGGFEDPMRMVWEVRAIISFLWDANLRLVCKLVYLPACSQTALYSRITGKPQWLCPKAVQSGDSSTSEICLLSRLGWKSRVGGVAIGGRTWMKLICSTQTFSGTKKKFTHTLSQHGKWPSSHWGFCIELRGLGSPCECPACLILYMQSCEPTLGKMQWFQSPVSHMTSWSFKAIYCDNVGIPDIAPEWRNLSRRGSVVQKEIGRPRGPSATVTRASALLCMEAAMGLTGLPLGSGSSKF